MEEVPLRRADYVLPGSDPHVQQPLCQAGHGRLRDADVFFMGFGLCLFGR